MNADARALTHRIALAHYRNINAASAQRFADKGISPEDVFCKPASPLASCTGIRSAFFDASRRAEAVAAAEAETEFITSSRISATYYTDEAYPARLAECDDAPAMLYAVGDMACTAARHSIAVVGTRHCTAYGADFTRRLVADLAAALDSLLVVSGLAYGVDICAHRAALEAGVPTVAVLAHGLNTIYPAEHRQDARRIAAERGAVMTEYRSCDRIHRGNFLARNRIVAGLADITVVVESDIRGGAMATARIASAYNREVGALPGRINDTYSRGCNHLIASRTASLVRDAADIIDIMGWTAKPAEGQQKEIAFEMPELYGRVLARLAEKPSSTVNDLCGALGLPYATLSSTLFEMEMDDLIIALPGGRFTLPAVR